MRRNLMIATGIVLAVGVAVLVIGPSPRSASESQPAPVSDPGAAPVSPPAEPGFLPEDPVASMAEPPGDSREEPTAEPAASAPEPTSVIPKEATPDPRSAAPTGTAPEPDVAVPPGDEAEHATILPAGGSLLDDRAAHALVWGFETRAYAERFVDFVSSRAESELGLELVATDASAWQVRVPYADEADRESRLEEIERITGFDLSVRAGH